MPAPELVETFLVIDQPRQRLGHWTEALAPLDADDAPPITSVVGYYDASSDQALIDLRYAEDVLGGDGMQFVVEVAVLADIGMIQPSELSEVERRRFYNERLANCIVSATRQRSAIRALTELVRKLKGQRAGRPTAPPHSDGDEPAPAVAAKGTRDDLENVSDAERLPARHVVRRATPPRVPLPQTQPAPPNAQTIYARYLRSGRWVATRVGALSLRGAALMTGALPRLHDHVDVALSYGGHRALVRGAVGKVSSVLEAQQSGASTFSVAFQLDDTARRQLTALLTAARAANVTIKPAPPRATRRFPVEWPVCLGTIKGAIKAHALDISTHGMFVKPALVLELGAALNFSVVLDDGAAPIAGRARIVRQVRDEEAQRCGLAPGFGLTITDMAESDRLRWFAFLGRVERRSEKRVLIGAAASRLGELQGHLAAAGYAVIGGTDPGALVQLANAGSRPVDAALIDATWLQQGPQATWIETLFSARNVPCITLHGDARKARNAIDRLLEVAV